MDVLESGLRKKLREAELLLGQRCTVGEVSCKLGAAERTYYRWRREYGGIRLDQARRFKELEKENGRLKRLVADLTLDNSILKEVMGEAQNFSRTAIAGGIFHLDIELEFSGTVFKEGLLVVRLTERARGGWGVYVLAGNNASQAARVAYRGTPISVRVKGHKKKVRLKPFLDRIDRIWDQWLGKEINQIEREVNGYLRRLGRGVKDWT